jgi:hypothetical protein
MDWPIRQALERSGLLIIQSGVDAVGLRSPVTPRPIRADIMATAAPTLAAALARPTR